MCRIIRVICLISQRKVQVCSRARTNTSRHLYVWQMYTNTPLDPTTTCKRQCHKRNRWSRCRNESTGRPHRRPRFVCTDSTSLVETLLFMATLHRRDARAERMAWASSGGLPRRGCVRRREWGDRGRWREEGRKGVGAERIFLQCCCEWPFAMHVGTGALDWLA